MRLQIREHAKSAAPAVAGTPRVGSHAAYPKANCVLSRTTSRPDVSIIIPALNEQSTIDAVVECVLAIPFTKEVLVVDDGSTDGTAERIMALGRLPQIASLFHDKNFGKGAAIRTGLARAQGEVIVIQDADLEYDPADIERLVAPIFAGTADVVFGSRFTSRSNVACSLFRRSANRFLTWLSNRFTGLRLSDMETCYKAMRREVVASTVLRESRFGIEPEITAKIARGKWRVAEVPISYHARNHAAGKKIRFRDGLRAVWCIVRYSRWD